MKEGYIKQSKRKKILLITDDPRVHSGVAHVSREIIINTCHKYNFACLAGGINHPDKGKKIDYSLEINNLSGVEDSYVVLYPQNGYGSPDFIRMLIKQEKIDAILLVTDPRYFTHIFQMENEIRRKVPIIYLNIWDNIPASHYNREAYESCDLLFGISKLSKLNNKLVLDGGNIPYIDLDSDKTKIYNESNKNRSCPILIKYLPHGLNDKNFYPLNEDNKDLIEFKKATFQNKYDFILLFNSKNINRKNIPNTILAWRLFIDNLPKEKAEKCLFILHTNPLDKNGTDLIAVSEYFCSDPKYNIIFSTNSLPPEKMNLLYNASDGVILASSNEGWGLALTESMLTGTPFIANVTGGMQDQMRFVDNNGEWFTPNIDVPTNNRKTYLKHGVWALPIFPDNTSIIGSLPTPYIYEDRCSPSDIKDQILRLYVTKPESRKEMGLEGRKWATSYEAGFTSKIMGDRFIEGVDFLFKNWVPRKRYEFIKDSDFKGRVLNHEIIF